MKFTLKMFSILLLAVLSSCAGNRDLHRTASYSYEKQREILPDKEHPDEHLNVNERDNNGGTPLITASCISSKYREVQLLLERGADVNAQDHDGMSPLIKAAICGNTAILRELISYGADINAKTNMGLTALMYASINGNEEIVRILLANGAGENPESIAFALKLAEHEGHKDIVDLLKNAGK